MDGPISSECHTKPFLSTHSKVRHNGKVASSTRYKHVISHPLPPHSPCLCTIRHQLVLGGFWFRIQFVVQVSPSTDPSSLITAMTSILQTIQTKSIDGKAFNALFKPLTDPLDTLPPDSNYSTNSLPLDNSSQRPSHHRSTSSSGCCKP